MNTFSFDELTAVRQIAINDVLQANIQIPAEESFHDDEGVTFTITRAVVANNTCYEKLSSIWIPGIKNMCFSSIRKTQSLGVMHFGVVSILCYLIN
jgi:hypothetical protein